MRFDDSLKTVLAADVTTTFGARAAFRQLVDLIGRGRAPADPALLDRVRSLAKAVPVEMRAGTARGLALADPPLELVALFASDAPDVASAMLRAARLDPEDWEALLPRLTPHGRSVLRQRRDLPPTVSRALETFGSADFALSHDTPDQVAPPQAFVAAESDPVITVAERPVVRAPAAAASNDDGSERFEIADLVHRIEAFQRERASNGARVEDPAPVHAFRFETDMAGTIRWVDTAPRGAIIGLSLSHEASGGVALHVDGVAAAIARAVFARDAAVNRKVFDIVGSQEPTNMAALSHMAARALRVSIAGVPVPLSAMTAPIGALERLGVPLPVSCAQLKMLALGIAGDASETSALFQERLTDTPNAAINDIFPRKMDTRDVLNIAQLSSAPLLAAGVSTRPLFASLSSIAAIDKMRQELHLSLQTTSTIALFVGCE